MTPLHDAASNGSLEVVELLLDRGASAIAKDLQGQAPLHVLQQWRETVSLDPIRQSHYETLLQRMQRVFDSSGRTNVEVKTIAFSTKFQIKKPGPGLLFSNEFRNQDGMYLVGLGKMGKQGAGEGGRSVPAVAKKEKHQSRYPTSGFSAPASGRRRFGPRAAVHVEN